MTIFDGVRELLAEHAPDTARETASNARRALGTVIGRLRGAPRFRAQRRTVTGLGRSVRAIRVRHTTGDVCPR